MASPKKTASKAGTTGAQSGASKRVVASAAKPGTAVAFASAVPGRNVPLPPELAEASLHLSSAFDDAPIWFLIQNRNAGPHQMIGPRVRDDLFSERPRLKHCETVVLVLDSAGGYADYAYQIGRYFQRHSGKFIVVVPRYAKSAATLLSLGAETIYMGDDAQLGPLDAQVDNQEAEENMSALDEVQALERLNASAITQVDQTMNMLVWRTGKKVQTLLPLALNFVAQSMAPLMEKIDAVHYTQQARVLKVAEDYAVRLLEANYESDSAERIAHELVHGYSEHGFVIDVEEIEQSDNLAALNVSRGNEAQAAAIERLEHFLTENRLTVVGPLLTKGTTS